MPERWTRGVLRRRTLVLAGWLTVLVAGTFAAVGLPGRLATSFAVPGTESEQARAILARHFDERPDGVFTVVFHTRDRDAAARRRLRRELVAAAAVVPTGHVQGSLRTGGGIVYGDIATTLDLQHAKAWTEPLRRALRAAGGPPALVTGQPAIQHDLEPVLAADLHHGEAIAIPAALALLLVVLGLSAAVLVPFVFAACTIAGTLALVSLLTHAWTTASYVSNVVELIGLGLAVDYSLLVVSRFREELARPWRAAPSGPHSGPPETSARGVRAARREDTDEAVVRTMATAGRAVVFSGLTVAIGLALLLAVPVPFIRSLGAGAALVPLVSVAAAITLQPALLSLLGRRGARRLPIARLLRDRLGLRLPVLPGTVDLDRGLWARLARAIMRRPVLFLAAGAILLGAATAPAAGLRLTPGSIAALPPGSDSVTGLDLLWNGVGAGALTPTEIVVDSGRPGGARTPAVRAAVSRLADAIFHDPEAYVTASGRRAPYVDPSGRYARLFVVGRHEYGAPQSRALVHRIRDTLVPKARFPAGVRVLAGGAPPQGVDYLARAYGRLPWLLAAALALTFLVLLRAFRSLLLPLKAVLLNLLTVTAVYGLLVAIFQDGIGAGLLGVQRVDAIEAWIPIFLFAILFGLSMDYEVF
ncbi:MAG TPA: MMPL family transporter, partial [Gaiellaceae bacterium]|nr:MMPL family transporter [Gaiellaceae bacterium]